MSYVLENATMIGLLSFFTMFVLIAFLTYRPGAKKNMQLHALIPLNEEK